MKTNTIMKIGAAGILIASGVVATGFGIESIASNFAAEAAGSAYNIELNASSFSIDANNVGHTKTANGNAVSFGLSGVTVEGDYIVMTDAAIEASTEEGATNEAVGSKIYNVTTDGSEGILGLQSISVTVAAATEDAPRAAKFGIFYSYVGYANRYTTFPAKNKDGINSHTFNVGATGDEQTFTVTFGEKAAPSYFCVFTVASTTAATSKISSIKATYACDPTADPEVYSTLDVSTEAEFRQALEYFGYGPGASTVGTVNVNADMTLSAEIVVEKATGQFTIQGTRDEPQYNIEGTIRTLSLYFSVSNLKVTHLYIGG